MVKLGWAGRGLAVVGIVAGGLLIACGNSGASPDAQRAIDAHTTPDATPAFDAHAPTIDGAPMIDALPAADAATTGQVTVIAYDPQTGLLADGAAVWFEDPDGTMTVAATDASGNATASVVTGASVTVVSVSTNPAQTLLRTIIDVQANDVLTFGSPLAPPNNGTYNLMFQVAFSPVNATDRVEVHLGSCNEGLNFGDHIHSPLGVNVDVPSSCATTDVILLDFDDSTATETLARYATVASQTIANNSLLTASDWITLPSVNLSLTDIPSPIVVQGANQNSLYDAPYFWLGENLGTGSGSYASSIALTGTEPPPGSQYTFDAQFSDGSGGGQVIEIIGSSPVSGDLDVGALLTLPWIDDFGSYDATTRLAQWSTVDGSAPDFVFAELQYTDSNSNPVYWELLAPGSVTSLSIPHVAANATSLEPPSITTDDQAVYVMLGGFVPSLSYSTIRNIPDSVDTNFVAPGTEVESSND